jgi:hypothetical protein
VALGIEARKAIIANCKMIQPFIPPVVAGRPWQDHPTEAIARERRFFSFERARAGTASKAMPAISISLTPVNCC